MDSYKFLLEVLKVNPFLAFFGFLLLLLAGFVSILIKNPPNDITPAVERLLHKALNFFMYGSLLIVIMLVLLSIFPPKKLVILSGQNGGSYNVVGNKLVRYLEPETSITGRYNISLEETEGAIDNCKRLNSDSIFSNDVKIGLFQLAAHQNATECKNQKFDYITPIYDEVIHFALRKKIFDELLRIGANEITPCSIASIGLPISIGKEGTATKITANYILNSCDKHNDTFHIIEDMDFSETIDSLKSENDKAKVKAGFFNQAEKSKLMTELVSNNDVCFLPLSDMEKIRDDLSLDNYIPNSDIADFYNRHMCHDTKHNIPFKSLSSMSVLAIEQNVDDEIVKKILEIFYKNIDNFRKDVATSFFDCQKAHTLIKTNSLLQDMHLHSEAEKYFVDNKC